MDGIDILRRLGCRTTIHAVLTGGESGTSTLATRSEAITFLRISRKTFDRHVAFRLTKIRIGTRIFFECKELETWLENQKVGPLAKIKGPVRNSSASGGRANVTIDRRAQQVLRKLRS